MTEGKREGKEREEKGKREYSVTRQTGKHKVPYN